MKICIDAGHGGKDAGAVGKYKEKDLNLKVALKLGEILKNSGQEVFYTRQTDVFLELADRVKISNNANVDIFVSIHQNGAENKSARGVETFCNTGSTKGKVLAQYVQNELVKLNYTPNRGVKEANFYVIKYTKAPAILVECGFVTNEQDADFVNQNIDNIALAIAKGIGKYLGFVVTEKKIKKAKVLATALNIREGAGIQYKILGTYKKGDIVEILEEHQGWYKTPKGWISATYVTLWQQFGEQLEEKKKARVLATALNIRQQPSTSAKILGQYKKGDIVEVLEEKQGWYRTNKGWISSTYVTLV